MCRGENKFSKMNHQLTSGKDFLFVCFLLDLFLKETVNDAWVMALETDNRIAAIMKNLFQISKLVNRFSNYFLGEL